MKHVGEWKRIYSMINLCGIFRSVRGQMWCCRTISSLVMKESLTVLMVNHAQVPLFSKTHSLATCADWYEDFVSLWFWTLQVFPMRMRNGWTMRLTGVFLAFIWTRMDCLAVAKSEAFSSGRALTTASIFRFQTFTSLFSSVQPQMKIVKYI